MGKFPMVSLAKKNNKKENFHAVTCWLLRSAPSWTRSSNVLTARGSGPVHPPLGRLGFQRGCPTPSATAAGRPLPLALASREVAAARYAVYRRAPRSSEPVNARRFPRSRPPTSSCVVLTPHTIDAMPAVFIGYGPKRWGRVDALIFTRNRKISSSEYPPTQRAHICHFFELNTERKSWHFVRLPLT